MIITRENVVMPHTKRNDLNRCDGLSRRGVLRLGQLAGLGIGLNSLNSVTCQATTATAPQAKNCILIWLDGGPSHLETFDLKPEAPSEVRGPLNPIATAISGIGISECMPELASRMGDLAIIRSMTSPLGEHNLGTHYMLTGYKPTPVLDYPSFHAVANHQLTSEKTVLPANIAIPEYRVGGAKYTGHGFLPAEFGQLSTNRFFFSTKPGNEHQFIFGSLFQGCFQVRRSQPRPHGFRGQL